MFQQTILIGNVGQDPQFSSLPNGTLVCEFSLATNKRWTDRNTGEKREKTVWHNIKAFGGMAESLQKGVQKGSKLFIEAESDTETWNDKNTGIKMYKTVYEPQAWFFAGAAPSARDNQQQGYDNYGHAQQQPAQPQQQTRGRQSQPNQPYQGNQQRNSGHRHHGSSNLC